MVLSCDKDSKLARAQSRWGDKRTRTGGREAKHLQLYRGHTARYTVTTRAFAMSDYHIFKSFTTSSTWRDIFYDFGIVVSSLLAGMAVFFMTVHLLAPSARMLLR